MISKLSVMILTVLMLQAGSQVPVNRTDTTLAKLGMIRSNTIDSGLEISECLVVHSDSTYHFEKRVQKMPSMVNELEIYEGSINRLQRDELLNIINAPKLSTLSDYVPPIFPISTSKFELFSVETTINNVQRHLGYFAFAGEAAPNTSPGNTPENIKQKWQDSRSALQPLVSWFDNFERGLRRTESPTGSCTDN
jgi:hypothetical protein